MSGVVTAAGPRQAGAGAVVGGANSFNNPGVKCHCEQLGAPLSRWAELGWPVIVIFSPQPSPALCY